ncbi:hypothetical protein CPB85DRAFT_550782 [Mucidula mucida]|nr:hypothetical protein CPB85DRAFT_550782 [Mucidula mucida]
MTALLVLAGLGLGVLGQQHAVCSDPEFSWSFNSLKQSPCQIGEALGNNCTSSGKFFIPPIPEGFHYAGIADTAATNCVCNHVYWSLLSVCAACQGAGISAFPSWSKNCTSQFDSYPNTIPDGTAVPHYAFLPLFSNGTFDFNAAFADHGAEATSGTTASSTSQTPSATSSGSQSTATSASSASSSGGGSSNAGPIAGGVVGGVVGLALVATGIFLFIRRRKRNSALEPVKDVVDDHPEGAVHPFSYQQPMMTGSQSMLTQRVYDPNDPSTFPPSTSPFQSSTGRHTPPPYASLQGTTHAHTPSVSGMSAATTYRGAPEI